MQREKAMRWAVGSLILLFAIALMGTLFVAAFPVRLFAPMLERRLSEAVGAPVSIGAIERDSWFSFTPEIAARDVRIRQPAWAGPGDLLRVEAARVKVPTLKVLSGRGFAIDALRISGLEANLVRDRAGRSNWSRSTPEVEKQPSRTSLSDLVVENSRFTLRDAKRELVLAGTVAANARDGVALEAKGSFRGTPATLTAHGAAVIGVDPSAPWPLSARLKAPILDLTAKGSMAGPLNASSMSLDVAAKGSDLKHLDTIIEAGLFGTQPIDLSATVRREGSDWFVDKLAGGIGRSRLAGAATVLKRDGRTKIDATIRASQFDFDSLADNAGLAAAKALRARIGPRVIPNTRINLSKMGPTDGVIRFRADRLLFRGDSVFRSLAGTIRLDHRDLRIENIVAGMAAGSLTGTLRVDSRAATPVLSTDLHFKGATLQQLIGAPDDVSGPVHGRVRLTGRGDTIRAALAHANGKAALISTSGSIRKMIAYVLGQDLSGAIGQAIGKHDRTVPLRCLIADFHAKDGVLTPMPLIIDTGVSIGEGKGRIVLDGERIDMTLTGRTRGKGILRITDPIRVGGTLTRPAITVAGLIPSEKPKAKGVVKALGRSIGSALGLRKDAPQPQRASAESIDCGTLAANALR